MVIIAVCVATGILAFSVFAFDAENKFFLQMFFFQYRSI